MRSRAAGVPSNRRVVPGRQAAGAERCREAQHGPELDGGVADHARIGSLSGPVGGREIVDDVRAELDAQIHHVHRDSQPVADPVDGVTGSRVGRLEPGEEVHGEDVGRLLPEEMGGDHGVHAAADGYRNHVAQASRMGRTSMALGGQAATHCSQMLHFSWSNRTSGFWATSLEKRRTRIFEYMRAASHVPDERISHVAGLIDRFGAPVNRAGQGCATGEPPVRVRKSPARCAFPGGGIRFVGLHEPSPANGRRRREQKNAGQK